MSDYTNLVKQLRTWQFSNVDEAADAFEVLRAEVLSLQEHITQRWGKAGLAYAARRGLRRAAKKGQGDG